MSDRRKPWWTIQFRALLAAEGRALLAGLPALIGLIAVLAVAAAASTTALNRRVAWHANEAQRRMAARDFDGALLCYLWLVRTVGDRPEFYHDMAQAHAAKGDRKRALATLTKIAPLRGKAGYSPAHLAAARLLLAGGDRSVATARAVEFHLKRALEGSAADDARVLLGQFYAATGRGRLAEPYLAKAAVRQPTLLILLSRLARAQGDEGQARDRAEQARKLFQKKAESQFDDPDSRLAWSEAVVCLDDFPGAVAVLERGIQVSGDPRYGRALAQVYGLWAESLPAGDEHAFAQRIALLDRGFKIDPNNRLLVRSIGAALQRLGAADDVLRERLETMLIKSKASAPAFSLLGCSALMRGRVDESRAYWEEAFRLDPGMAIVANNVAWMLAHDDHPDLDRSLDLANRAVAREPSNPHFRGTRGYVLLKLGRWQEALPDLEAELAAFPDRSQTHLALAEVYDHLGLPSASAVHRKATDSRAASTDHYSHAPSREPY